MSITFVIFAIFITLCKTEHQSNISSTSTSNEIDSNIIPSTEIHCDTDVRLYKISFNWNINQFSSYKPYGSTNYSIISPTFSSATNDKVKWYLKILPGNQASKFIKLEVCSSPENNETARGKMNLQLSNSEDTVFKYAKELFFEFSVRHRCWAFNEIPVDKVLPDDKLKIAINITFCENCTNNVFYHPNRTNPTPHPECDLRQDFGHLLKNPEFSDLVLISKNGKKYPAHKAILAANSPTFAAMFKRHKEKSKKTRRVNIGTVDEQVFEEILRYIYTGKCENIDKFDHGLFVAAHEFGLDGLKTICLEQISKNLTTGNAVDTLLLADKRGFAELKSKAIRIIASNYAEISNTTDWKRIIKTNGRLVHEVCQSVVKL